MKNKLVTNMYALVIGRSFPEEKTGMMGIFEFEQAVALNKYGIKSVYAFCDTRSIKSLRLVNSIHMKTNNIHVYGYYFPIGGLPRKLFDNIKTTMYKRLLNKIINKMGKPTVIYIHFPLLTLTEKIWELLKALSVPIIITEHWSKVQLKTIESYRVGFLKMIVEESDDFNCVSQPLRKSVIELTNTSKKIDIIPNMVKPSFRYENKNKHYSRFEFIFIGRLVHTKRIGLLIEAFSNAFRDHKNVYLNIVGDGPLFTSLQKMINELGMSERIIMHGFQPRDKTATLLKQSDVFVSASVVETFGVPFIEAMACGKPVIGVENGPISSYINDSNGLLFKEDDIEDLITCLKTMLEKKHKYNSKQISHFAINTFSEAAIANKLITKINYLINRY